MEKLDNEKESVKLIVAVSKPVLDTNKRAAIVPDPAFAKTIVQVTAPMDLPGGYFMDVDVDGKWMVVVVPEGGAKARKTFRANVVKLGDVDDHHHVPRGKWRDHYVAFFKHTPSCCCVVLCPELAMAQVMTRMHLDWCGRPSKTACWTPFRVILTMLAGFFCLGFVEGSLGDTGALPDWWATLNRLCELAFVAYFFVLLYRVRRFVRSKYNITHEYPCGTFCDVIVCFRCTIAQMMRHTADYEAQPVGCCDSACCSSNGLANHPPAYIV